MFAFKTEPQPISGVIADGVRLFRASFSKIWPWALLIVLPGTVLSTFMDYTDPSASVAPGLTVVLMAFFFINLLIYVIGAGFICCRTHAVAIEGDTHIKPSLVTAIKKMLPIIFGSITVYVALLIVPALSALLLLVDMKLGFIVMIIMAVLFLGFAPFYFCLFPLFILLENQRVLSALKSSVAHMKNNMWRTIGMYLVLYLVVIGLALIVAMLAMLIGFFVPIKMVTGLISLVLPFILLSVLLSLAISMFLVLYHDVKLRKKVHVDAAPYGITS